MKKFISMIAGVVMASSLFAASAYAADTVTAKISAETVKVGDTVTVVLNKNANTLTIDSFGVDFNGEEFELIDVIDNENYPLTGGESLFQTSWYFSSRKNGNVSYMTADTVADMTANGAVSFAAQVPEALDAQLGAVENFATIQFKALKAGTYDLRLWADCAGTDAFNGTLNTYSIKVEAPVSKTWKENVSWSDPDDANKTAIWWGFDIAAETFGDHQFVTVTDGADVPKTKTVGIGLADDYEVSGEGNVSFAVAVILDKADVTDKFDAYLGR